MRRARENQWIGSEHTVPRLKMCRPRGTPTMGVPEPTTHGHRPHTCTVVARHSGGASMSETLPPPTPGQPRGPGRRAGAGRALAWRLACVVGLASSGLARPSSTATSWPVARRRGLTGTAAG